MTNEQLAAAMAENLLARMRKTASGEIVAFDKLHVTEVLLTAVDQIAKERDEYRTLAGIGAWHADCRPNRQMAAREMQKSQAVIDKLADTISAQTKRAEQAEAALAALTQERAI